MPNQIIFNIYCRQDWCWQTVNEYRNHAVHISRDLIGRMNKWTSPILINMTLTDTYEILCVTLDDIRKIR